MCRVINNAVTGSLASALHASCCQLWMQLSLLRAFAQIEPYSGMHRAASSKAVANLQLQLGFHCTTPPGL